MKKHIIDCNTKPKEPYLWSIDKHKKGGLLEWKPKKIQLYLAEYQKYGRGVNGVPLQKELKTLCVLNANVLDYLLAHPELIPEKWKGKHIYFWGTTYLAGFSNYRSVRGLMFDQQSKQWLNTGLSICCEFDALRPAVILIK